MMQVRESETGLVRLFALDLSSQDAEALRSAPETVAAYLGQSHLAENQWEIFDTTDLAELGLQAYLAEGHGIPPDDLAPHGTLLTDLSGSLLIVRSAAIKDRPTVLTPLPPLRWVATFGEIAAPVPLATHIDTPNAQGQLQNPDPSENTGKPLRQALWVVVTLAVALAALIWAVLAV